MARAIFETYVSSEIIKSYWNSGIKTNIYFYRDKDLKEIDLIIERNGTLYLIEIKKTATSSKNMINAFSCLDKLEHPIVPGALICMAEEFAPLSVSAFQ